MTDAAHACPVCRCKWNPDPRSPGFEGYTQIEAVARNVQRMAAEIRQLRQGGKS